MLQPNKEHIEYQIPPQAHTPMYVWHKYWARKTWNVVGEWIESYCPEGGIVLDPFMGSGVAVIEALRCGRRAIGIDLNPIATEIVELTLRDVDTEGLRRAYDRVKKAVAEDIGSVYKTSCRKCRKETDAACFVWQGNKPISVRYVCEKCGHREEKGSRLNDSDRELVSEVARRLKAEHLWYPNNPLRYPNDSPFLKREKYETVSELFTPRNLYSLAKLIKTINAEPNALNRRYLRAAFSSMVHLCAKIVPAISSADTNHQTPFSSTWTQHSYWSAPKSMEQPVWRKFESAFEGSQGILKAKEESKVVFEKPVRFATSAKRFFEGEGDVLLVCGSALENLKKWRGKLGIRARIDYCFTDPPYASSIQYGELSFMWVSWLGFNGKYLENLVDHEVVENPRQGKNFAYYDGMLSATLGELNQILKPQAHMTLTFHNPTFKVRNATIRAGVRNNFDFEKIYHQPTAVKSAKSLLQPFGSATGDFYLRFSKPEIWQKSGLRAWDSARFERTVVDAVKQLLAERWEPSPYTIIINYIDPILAREGFYQELYPGLDVNTVLRNHEGTDFQLVDIKIGGAAGKAWWFANPREVQIKGIPLIERVEASVIRELNRGVRVSFTDVWRKIGEEFPNSLTPDALSIKEVLKEYARESQGGEWQILPLVKERISEHPLMVSILAEIGRKLKYKIWIARDEQGKSPKGKMKLSECVSAKIPDFAPENRTARNAITSMDLLWIQKSKIIAAFEIEYSTTITSAIERGSHLPQETPKYIVLPSERAKKLLQKLESPFFRHGFDEGQWRVLWFDSIVDSAPKLETGALSIDSIKWDCHNAPGKRDRGQLSLV
jgi:16S rRNA G966 N2-methylase RsmD